MKSALADRVSVGKRPAILLGIVLVGLAVLLGRHLGVPSAAADEGLYLGAGSALAHGDALGTEVRAHQPPLTFLAMTLGWRLTGGSLALMQGLTMLIALAGCAAGYALIRPRAGVSAGLAAAGLLGLAFSQAAAVVRPDVPCVALGVAALAAGDRAARRPAWAVAAGGLLAAAVLVKVLALPFVAALAALVVVRRPALRTVALMALGALLVAAATLAPYADQVGALWTQALQYRADRPFEIKIPGRVLSGAGVTYALLGALVAAVALSPPPSLREWLRDRAPLIVLLVSGVAMVLRINPLNGSHLVILSAPLALLAASSWPRARGRVVQVPAAAVILVGLVVAGRQVIGTEELATVDRAAAVVRAHTLASERVVSDVPLVPLRAGRAAVPQTIDSSTLEIKTGAVTQSTVIAASRRAAAVVMARGFRRFDGLEAELAPRFPYRRRFAATKSAELTKGDITVLFARR